MNEKYYATNENLELLKKEQPRKYCKDSIIKIFSRKPKLEDSNIFKKRLDITKIYILSGFNYDMAISRGITEIEHRYKCRYI